MTLEFLVCKLLDLMPSYVQRNPVGSPKKCAGVNFLPRTQLDLWWRIEGPTLKKEAPMHGTLG